MENGVGNTDVAGAGAGDGGGGSRIAIIRLEHLHDSGFMDVKARLEFRFHLTQKAPRMQRFPERSLEAGRAVEQPMSRRRSLRFCPLIGTMRRLFRVFT
jgi:hypothetical protein